MLQGCFFSIGPELKFHGGLPKVSLRLEQLFQSNLLKLWPEVGRGKTGNQLLRNRDLISRRPPQHQADPLGQDLKVDKFFNNNQCYHIIITYQYQSSKLMGLIFQSTTMVSRRSVDYKKTSGHVMYSKYWQGTASPLLWWGGRNWIIDKRTSRSLRVLSQYICPLVMKYFSRNRIHFEFIEAYQIYFCFKLS